MVVDDEPLICETVALLLQIDGHQVDRASNAEQALALFNSTKFDLVITDFAMPVMNGDKLAAALKTHCPSMPVVMLTGCPEKISREIPQNFVDLYIGKPFDLEALRVAIQKCMTPKQPLTEASRN